MNNARYYQEMRIRSAGYWLELGEADQALRELEALSRADWNRPLAIKTRVAALKLLARTSGLSSQERGEVV